jgi:hypothetical protein
MVSFLVICIFAGCLLGGLAWIRNRRDSEFTPAPKIARENRTQFKAVEVCPGSVCCQAAMESAGKRILLEHSPRMPLDKCDRIADCKCTYINHLDRRAGDDRRNPFGSLSQAGMIGMQEANLRAGMDRRESVDSDLDNLEYEKE